MRSADIARAHGLTSQAIRDYENVGLIPLARRGGYRQHAEAHPAGVAATPRGCCGYSALVPACGYPSSRSIMLAVTGEDLDHALELIDEGHALLDRDRDRDTATG